GNAEVSGQLARAARDYLKADDKAAAEQALRAALERAPERGDLYRTLAVDVYAARGDFPAAESVLQAGERNALDMLPVYEGVTEVLARRESMGVEKMASAEPPPRAPGDAEVVPWASHHSSPRPAPRRASAGMPCGRGASAGPRWRRAS